MDFLHVDSITKSFNSKTLFNNLFFSCKTGDIIGLLGRNGTGKSTLLKIIFGVEQADFKFQKVNNRVITKTSQSQRLINYLPQDGFLPKHTKIKVLIKLFCTNKSINTLFKNELLQPLLNKKSNELSGGEKRIVEILMILNTNAKFVLLDEPFNGISPINKTIIKKLIQQKSSSKGIVITDHDYQNVLDIANKIQLLENGSLHVIENESELYKYGYIT